MSALRVDMCDNQNCKLYYLGAPAHSSMSTARARNFISRSKLPHSSSDSCLYPYDIPIQQLHNFLLRTKLQFRNVLSFHSRYLGSINRRNCVITRSGEQISNAFRKSTCTWHKRPSRAQHVISIQDYRHKDPREHCKTPVEIPHGRHTHAFIKRGWSSMPWTSPWPSGLVLTAGRFLVEEGTLSDPYSGFSLLVGRFARVDRQEASLDVTTWRRSRYLEATCWSALGGCKQGEAELAPCPEAAAALSVLSGGRLLRLFTLSTSQSLPFLVLISRIAWWPWCPFACACHDPGEFVPAGWSVSLAVRLRRCAAAHGGVMATLSWLWGSPRARSHPHAMWKGDQYLTPAIPAFPPRGRSSVPLRRRTVAPILMSVVSLPLVGVVAVTMVAVASKQPRGASLALPSGRCREDGRFQGYYRWNGRVNTSAPRRPRARASLSSFSAIMKLHAC